MVASIAFDVTYGQLAVFASALLQPFNDWSAQHVAQGFSWRPGSVSFRTMVEAGEHLVEVDVADHAGALHPDVVRAIEVPFEVPADGAIEIGSVTETIPVFLPAGLFLLRCEFLQPGCDFTQRVQLTFVRKDTPRFAVLRADPELSPADELLISAQPALG